MQRIVAISKGEDRATPTGPALFQLNRASSRQSLLRRFRRYGRVQVPDVLRQRDAQALYRCLSACTQWGLLLKSGPGIGRRYVEPEQYQSFTEEQLRIVYNMAHAFKGRGGSHLVAVRPISDDPIERESDPSLMARFSDFCNTNRFLNFVRDITGLPEIRSVSTQAMCLTKGHFFSLHSDAAPEDRQLATAVFSLTPTWERTWGGLLQFASAKGRVEEVVVPRFNTLNVFRYSQRHAVSVVKQQARYSIVVALRL